MVNVVVARSKRRVVLSQSMRFTQLGKRIVGGFHRGSSNSCAQVRARVAGRYSAVRLWLIRARSVCGMHGVNYFK